MSDCVVCNRPSKYVCIYCGGKSGGAALFCADHRCIHFADQIAKEFEESKPKPPRQTFNWIVFIIVIVGIIIMYHLANPHGCTMNCDPGGPP